MRRYSITDKFIIASFVISMIVVTVVASYSFYKAKSAILERTFKQLNSVKTIKSKLLQNFFDNCVNEIKLAQTSTDFHHLLTRINHVNPPEHFSVINTLVPTVKQSFFKAISRDYYSRIYLIGKDKQVYIIKGDLKTSPEYYRHIWKKIRTDSKVVISDYQSWDSFRKPVSISIPIHEKQNNSYRGILVFEINPESIDAIMRNDNPASGLGISGESYLVGPDSLMRSASRFIANSVLNTEVNTQAVQKAFQGQNRTEIIDDYRNIKVLSSFSKVAIPDINWVILAEMDYKEATVPIYQIRYEIIFISIFIFLIVLIIVIVLSKRITQPIEKLNEAVHEIGQGNLSVELHYKDDDEIGELTDTFNLMTQKLRNKSEELEKERIKSMRSLIDGQEIERQRLSRELHDSLGQLLIALKLKYESASNKKELGELFDKTIEETRRISNNLMPAALAEFGLTTALRNICNDLSENTGTQVKLKTQGAVKNLNTETKIYLFRIIQEALTNIVKHAKAKKATIAISVDKNQINVLIKDDGIGFNPKTNSGKKSNGLNNIKDRVSLLGGEIKLTSEKNKGTRMQITIPKKDKTHE